MPTLWRTRRSAAQRAALLLPAALALALSGCAAPLSREPWALARAGSTGIGPRAGLWGESSVESTYRFDSNFGPFEITDSTRLAPRGDLGLGLEHFVWDDVSLLLGVDGRAFQPADIGPGTIRFDPVLQVDAYAGARWLMPWSFARERLRPFAQLVLISYPDTAFDATFDLGAPSFPPARFSFRGSPAWNLGAGGGLAYQLSDHWAAHLLWQYDWNLVPSRGSTTIDILSAPLDTDVDLAPGGWVAYASLTYYL